MEKRRGEKRGAEGGEEREEERQVGHVEGINTASSVRRVEKRRENISKKQSE